MATAREPSPQLRHSLARHTRDKASAKKIIGAQDADIADRNPRLEAQGWHAISDTTAFASTDEYFASRAKLVEREKTIDFDFSCRSNASGLEPRVHDIIQELRARDKLVYDQEQPRRGYGGQEHRRFAGDHFLSNVDLINKTGLLDVARMMPKGAHLHIHFNSCLRPNVLLDIAKKMDRMFITSDLPLIGDDDYFNFRKCEIQFSIMKPENERPGNLFSRDYRDRETMRFADFLCEFSRHYPAATADEWLAEKLVFQESEAHNIAQTALGYVSAILCPCHQPIR